MRHAGGCRGRDLAVRRPAAVRRGPARCRASVETGQSRGPSRLRARHDRCTLPGMDTPRAPLFMGLVVLLGACAGRESPELSPADDPARPTAALASGSIDRWLGDWVGSDGSALRLEGGDGRYEVTLIEPDDGDSRSYHGIAATAERIIFDRDGDTLSLTPVDAGPDCLALDDIAAYCRG